MCAFVICNVSKTKRINNATVHSGQLDWRVNSVCCKSKEDGCFTSSAHPANSQTVKAVHAPVKIVLKRFLPRSVRVWIGHLACVTSTVRLCSTATEALNKSQRAIPFFFPTFRCLLFVFDKRQDDSPALRASPLITYRLRVMSDLISSEFYPGFLLMASKQDWCRGGLW